MSTSTKTRGTSTTAPSKPTRKRRGRTPTHRAGTRRDDHKPRHR